MSPFKILIADDEKDVLDIMAKKIKANGYSAVKASNGQEAWEKIQKESPDIILLDLNMPKMDGFAVLKKLREDPSSEKWQPVIIISARTELVDMKKGFELEADHYLTKPCQIGDILKAIKLMEQLIPQRKSKIEMKTQQKPSEAQDQKKG